MRPPPFAPAAQVALIVAHPGHELRLFHWLHVTHPLVSVLTDGSGNTGASRIDSTTHILRAAGARPGPVYAAMSDHRAYQAILAEDVEFFHAQFELLADSLVAGEIDDVVFDAAEGFNPMHDMCHLGAAAAARLAAARRQLPVRAWDFPLEGHPGACEPALQSRAVTWQLDPRQFRRKLEAMTGFSELRSEIERTLAQVGCDAFALERVRPATRGWLDPAPDGALPQYETYGRDRVSSGRYATVIRFSEHIQPLATAIDSLIPALA